MSNDETQPAYNQLNANAQSYFKSFVTVAVGAVDQNILTHEAAIGSLIAAASVVAGDMPDGIDVFERKVEDILNQMRRQEATGDDGSRKLQ